MAIANLNVPVVNGSKAIKPEVMPVADRTDVSGHAIRNVVLLSIPDEEFNLLRPHLELLDLPQYFILHQPAERITHGYFLNEGLASLVAVNGDGRSVEVGIVGREGMVGTSLVVGLNRGCFRGIMQISGSGLRINSETLTDLLPLTPTLRDELLRYTLVHGLQVGQIAACNRLHELDQRLARWLLMCQDRVDSETISLTHEFLAQMLGTGRPSVTLAAQALEKSGGMENLRGRMRILNRKQLEASACECYRMIQNLNGALRLK